MPRKPLFSDASTGTGADLPTIDVLLVAPNVSARMGGEAIKALHIAQGFQAAGLRVIQVTHARVRAELTRDFRDLPCVFVEDDALQRWSWRLRLTPLLALIGAWKLHALAVRTARATGARVVHYSAPISPVLPYFRWPRALSRTLVTVIGPLNGNLDHPDAFAGRDSRLKRWLRTGQPWLQRVLGVLFHGKRTADCVLVSGGGRTHLVLQQGGVRAEQMHDTLDAGVDPRLFALPRPDPRRAIRDFIFVGRLIRLKGCDLALKALARVPSATMTLVGEGDERPALEALARNLGVADRVTFAGWVNSGPDLWALMQQHRAFVFPSLNEANGMAVQEAMALALPVIALDWGGPQTLLAKGGGVLVPPDGEAAVIGALAAAMAGVKADPENAARLGAEARQQALQAGFEWTALLSRWRTLYSDALTARGLGDLGADHRAGAEMPAWSKAADLASPRENDA